jgi:hypothetical protein
MLNYVTTVLVSNLAAGTILTSLPEENTKAAAAAHAGKFIIMNCDANVASTELYNVTSSNAGTIQTIKVGVVTKNVAVIRKPNGTVKYMPMVKWSNQIKAADIKSYNVLSYAADTEDTAYINFNGLTDVVGSNNSATAGKRIIVRLTYKDMPHRFRKWTESYEYITADGDTKAKIAQNIANMINREWKRARIEAVQGTYTAANGNTPASFSASASGTTIKLVALPYDDDDAVDTLNVANKVRFNVNVYWTDPQADGWESKNKHFPAGTVIIKEPGKQYAASAKLVRDREAWAMGYQGILNRGEGTWPIIKPDMETSLSGTYDAIILEHENMYRAADDIQRKTKQVLEVYAEGITSLKAILDAFVGGTQQDEIVIPKPVAAQSNG